MRLLIIGPQGSGKGTQAKKLADRLNAVHISVGDIFRLGFKLMNLGTLVGRSTWGGILAAVAVHVLVFAFAPSMEVTNQGAAAAEVFDWRPQNEISLVS